MDLRVNIIEKHELTDIWPGKKNAYKCVMLNKDNTKFETEIPKAECELVMYLKLLKSKLNQAELTRLEELISAYGDERYYEANLDASMNDESI